MPFIWAATAEELMADELDSFETEEEVAMAIPALIMKYEKLGFYCLDENV